MVPVSSKQLSYGHFVYLTQRIKTFAFKKENSTFFSWRKVGYANKLIRKREGEKKRMKKRKEGKRKERKGSKERREDGDRWTESVSKSIPC